MQVTEFTEPNNRSVLNDETDEIINYFPCNELCS